jgi:hypothetical protein
MSKMNQGKVVTSIYWRHLSTELSDNRSFRRPMLLIREHKELLHAGIVFVINNNHTSPKLMSPAKVMFANEAWVCEIAAIG